MGNRSNKFFDRSNREHNFQDSEDDECRWSDEVTHVFTVKYAYKLLDKEENEENNTILDQFWNIKALPSAQVVGWKILLNKVSTKVNLHNRGIELENIMCLMP